LPLLEKDASFRPKLLALLRAAQRRNPLLYPYRLPAHTAAVVLVLAVACPLSPNPKITSSRPKAAHFAAAVERSLYFVFALAFWLLQLLLSLFLPLHLLLLVLRRHSERSEESRISEGSVATRVPFSSPHPNTVNSTGAAHRLIPHTASEPKPQFLPLLPIPYSLFFLSSPQTT
jgi:hypothetical protein